MATYYITPSISYSVPDVYIGKEPSEYFWYCYELRKISDDSLVQSHLDAYRANYPIDSITKDSPYVYFDYTYNGETITYYAKNITNSAVKAVGLKTVYDSKITPKKYYREGDVINLNEEGFFDDWGYFEYEDGSVLKVSELETTGHSASILRVDETLVGFPNNIRELDYELDNKGEITVVWISKHFGTLRHTYGIEIENVLGEDVTEFNVAGYVTEFIANEVYDIGEDSYAKVKQNNIWRVIPVDYDSWGQWNIKCSFNGTVLDSSYWKDEIFYANVTMWDNLKYNVPFTVSYYEEKIKVKSHPVKYYLNDSENLVVDLSKVLAYKLYHENYINDDGELKTTILENAVDFTDKTLTVNASDLSLDETGETSVMYTVETSVEDEETNQILYLSFPVFLYRKKAMRLEATSETSYLTSGFNTFVAPTVTKVYNDGTKESYTDTSNLVYYNKYGAVVEVGKTIITEGISSITVVDTDLEVSGTYSLNFTEDYITSLELVENTLIDNTLGNYYNKYKNEIFNALRSVYNSGNKRMLNTTISDIINLSFKNEGFRMYADQDSVLNVTFNGKDYEVDIEGAFADNVPNIESVTLDIGDMPTAYGNYGSIDCTKVKINVAYVGAEYKEELSYESSGVSISSSTENITFTDGIGAIAYSELDTINKNETITFEVTSVFDDTETSSASQDIVVYGIKKITGIRITKSYTEYNVGDLFLNENDDTTLEIDIEDDQGNTATVQNIQLKNGFRLLNVNPLKGTKLTNVEQNKAIRVYFVGDSNVVAEYLINVGSKEITASSTKEYNVVASKLDRKEYDESKPSSYVMRSAVSGTGSSNIGDLSSVPWLDKYLLIKQTKYPSDYPISALQGLDTTYIENGIRKITTNGASLYTVVNTAKEEEYFIGYLEDVGRQNQNARVILFKDYIPPVDGMSNIKVKFPCYVEGNADRINKCKFGIFFGNNNAKNRLFLSGNEDYANCDWHSNDINSFDNLSGNFSYFEDTSIFHYGETDNKVIGYDIVSNNKLMVLKDHSDKETSIYFRTPTLVEAIDGAGNIKKDINGNTLYQEEYINTKGNGSVAGISAHAITNLNGDTLFVSEENKIVGLDIEGIIGDNQRYANTRSLYIDQYLKDINMSNAVLWSNNTELYLILEDRVFMTNKDTLHNGQYEWWLLNIPNIVSIFEINKVRYFETRDGKLLKYNNIFEDIKKVFIADGGAQVEIKDGYEIINNVYLADLDLTKEHTLRILPTDDYEYLYQKIATISDNLGTSPDFYSAPEHSDKLKVSATGDAYDRLNDLIIEGKWIYFDYEATGITDRVIEKNKRYKLVNINDEGSFEEYYQVIDENEDVIDVSKIKNATICYRLEDEYKMVDIDKENSTFKLQFNGQYIDIIQYNLESPNVNIKAQIKEFHNVEAYYITKPYDLGTLDRFKTIWSWTLTNDTGIPSEVEVTFTNNIIPNEKSTVILKLDMKKKNSNASLEFNLQDMDFTKVDFNKNIVPRTYTNQRILSNVKFVCFGFRNINNTNSCLCTMSFVYTLPYASYGSN